MKRLLALPLLLLLLCAVQGCTAVYGTATDERLMDTMANDNVTAKAIKTNLMSVNVSDGWSISVYCYYGHVFLVGECPKEMRAKAVAIARQDKRCRSVTTHWFSKREGKENDFLLAASLRGKLIGTSKLNSTRIDTEVNADRVVLLGVASSSEERKLAVRTAREVEGVDTVTSYIMLPLKEGQNPEPTGITYEGLRRNGKAPAKKSEAKGAEAPKAESPKAEQAPKAAPKSATKSSGGVEERDI